MSIKVKVGGSKSIRSVPKQDSTRTVVAAGEKKPVITPDSIALGVDTVGAYVRSIQEGIGLDVTLNNREDAEVTISHEITTAEVSSNNSILGFTRNVDIDQFGHVTAFYNSSLNPDNFTSDGTIITAKDIVFGNTAITIGESTDTIEGLSSFNVGDLTLTGSTISSPATINFNSNTSLINVGGATITGLGTPTGPSDAVTVDYLSNSLTTVPDPVDPTDATNKRYVDLQRDNILSRMTALAATTADLGSNYTFSGNTITRIPGPSFQIDAVTIWEVGDGLLVKDQNDPTQNGHYQLTQKGDATTPWILERSTLTNESGEIAGNAVFVTDGFANKHTGWVATVEDDERFVLGTDDITYVQFQGEGLYTAGRGLTLLNNTEFEVDHTQTFSTINGLGDNLIISSTLVDVNSNGGLILPVGTTLQRPTPQQGMIRYNTTDSRFEAYNGVTWSGLGGVVDADQDTYIRAETSAGADGDDLEFFTANVRRLIIDDQGDLKYGVASNRFTVDFNTGDAIFKGAVDFQARSAITIPRGFTIERPSTPVAGMIRFNDTTDSFEGYNGNNWGTLGGLVDSDQDTYIRVEASPGTDNDDIEFYTRGTRRLIIDQDGNINIGAASNKITIDYLTGDTVFAGSVDFNSVGAITVPNGATVQRPLTPDEGMLRFNSTDGRFEGYDGTNWAGLGGVSDLDNDTYIKAETNPGDDNDRLDFYTAGVERIRLNSLGNFRFGQNFDKFTVDYATGHGSFAGTLDVGNQLTAASAAVQDLTIARVVHVGNNGELIDDDGFTFFNDELTVPDLHATGDLTVDGDTSFGQLSVGDLTPNRVIFAGPDGRLTTDTTLRFSTTGPRMVVKGFLDVEKDLTIGGNLIIGDAATDTVTVVSDFDSNLVPDEFGNYTLGTIGKNWHRVFTPTILSDTEIVTIDGAGALKLPVGTRAEGPDASTRQAGMIRFNSQDNRFEGYDGTRWSGLAGSVVDIDQDTKILAESTSDVDRLEFFTQGVRRFFIENDGKITTDSGVDLVFDVSGNINVGDNIITGLAKPVNPTDAVSKEYLEDDFTSTMTFNQENGPLTGITRTVDAVADPTINLVNGLEIKAFDTANNSIDLGLTSPMAGSTGVYGNDGFTPRIRVTEDGRIDFATEIPVELQANAIPDFTETARDIIALMLEEGIQRGIAVTNDDANDTMDFIVDDFDIILTGDVTGTGRVTAASNTTISTSIDTAALDLRYLNTTGDTATGDLAAPRFVDSGNTVFYVEPADVSRIKDLHVGYLNQSARIDLSDGIGTVSTIFALGGKIGFLNSSANWSLNVDKTTGQLSAFGDTHSYKFVDLDAPTYFLHPGDTDSVFKQLALDNQLDVGSNLTVDSLGLSTVAGDLILRPQSGTIDANTSIISNLSDPIANLDAVNKQYLDGQLSTSINNLVGGAGLTYNANTTTFDANVDNITLEIVGDIIRVKDSGIANAKIANPFISFAAETGNTDIVSLGEVITFAAGEGIDTQVSNNQILIAGELATTTNVGVASFAAANFNVNSGEVTVAEIDGGTF